jgi:serine protease
MMNRFGAKQLLAASVAVAFSFPLFAMGSTQAASVGTGASANFNVSSLTTGGLYNRLIVRYRAGAAEQASPAAALQSVKAAVSRAGIARATLAGANGVKFGRKLATGSSLMMLSEKLSPTEMASLVRSIAADPAVEFVAPDVLRHAVRDIKAPALAKSAAFTPDDQYFAKYQTDYLPADGTKTPGNAIANYAGSNVVGAWDLTDGTGVTIAVLDTGIVEHADVNTSMANAGYDFIVDKFVSGRATDGRVAGGWDTGDWTTGSTYLASNGGCVDADNPAEDSSWHGTHVASAAGAEITNNGQWAAGIAYNAKVIPVRVLGHCGGYDSDINDAIVWAAGGEVDGVPANPNPAQVINMSLGGSGACAANDDAAIAIAKANALGAVVVVAAGNDGKAAANYSPASCPGAITVASLGISSKLAFYSNFNTSSSGVVALGAPGGGVYKNDGSSGAQVNPEGFMWQALNDGLTTPLASPDGDDMGGFAGTSQATPHVAGTAALMQSARLDAGLPLLTPDVVKSLLQSTAGTPNITPAAAKSFGAGVLNAGAAVAAAAAYGDGGGDPGDPVATPLTSGVTLANQSGAAASSALYSVTVPAGALAFTVRTSAGTGDVSLYVKAGAAGSATDYTYKSVHAGNAESVAISRPAATTYYVTVIGEKAYSGVSVLATFVAPAR